MSARKIGCNYCPSLISRGNITTYVKMMHGASYNCEQSQRGLKN